MDAKDSDAKDLKGIEDQYKNVPVGGGPLYGMMQLGTFRYIASKADPVPLAMQQALEAYKDLPDSTVIEVWG